MAVANLVKAVEYFDSVGRIDDADFVVNRVLSVTDNCKGVFYGLAIYVGFVSHLNKTRRYAAAISMCERMRVWASKQREGEWKTSSILGHYAQALSALGRIDEATSVFNDLVSQVRQSRDKEWNQIAAEFFADTGNFELAIKAYQILARCFEENTQTQRDFERDQPLCATLLSLATIQQCDKQYEQALKTLQKALSIYARSDGEQRLLETERIPFFYPAPSCIELKIAELCVELKDYESANNHIRNALQRAELACGSESANLVSLLAIAARLFRQTGDDAEADALERRCSDLSNNIEISSGTIATNKDNATHAIVSAAHRAIKNYNEDCDTAHGAIAALLNRLDVCIDDKECRSLWQSAGYLFSLLAEKASDVQVDEVLDRLVNIKKNLNAPRFVLLGPMTAKAISASERGLDAEDYWLQVEDALREESVTGTDGDSPRSQTAVPLSELLRRLAMTYFYCKDYRSASAILRRATTTSQPISDAPQVLPIAQEEFNQLLRLDALLVKHQMEGAEASLDAAERILQSDALAPSSGKKLVQLAMLASDFAGGTRSIALIEQAIARHLKVTGHAQQSGFVSPGLLLWKLAQLRTHRNEFAAAKGALTVIQTNYAFVSVPLGLALLAAKIFEEVGDMRSAVNRLIEADNPFIKTPGLEYPVLDLRRLILERALADAQTEPEMFSEQRKIILQNLASIFKHFDKDIAQAYLERSTASSSSSRETLLPSSTPTPEPTVLIMEHQHIASLQTFERVSDAASYERYIQARIESVWAPPVKLWSVVIKLECTLDPGGNVKNLRLAKSSGRALANQAAIKAVQRAAPFGKVPDEPRSSGRLAISFNHDTFKVSVRLV